MDPRKKRIRRVQRLAEAAVPLKHFWEGISHEACSLAGTLKLGKLICLYDDNDISIDGEVSGWFTDDTAGRFAAYGWQVIDKVDGHDSAAVAAAIDTALAEPERPSLICCKTVIGFGAPNKQGTASTHGAPLGDEEVAASRDELDWDYPPFEIPKEILDGWNALERGSRYEENRNDRFAQYKETYAELGGLASTGSSLRWRRTSSARPLAVS